METKLLAVILGFAISSGGFWLTMLVTYKLMLAMHAPPYRAAANAIAAAIGSMVAPLLLCTLLIVKRMLPGNEGEGMLGALLAIILVVVSTLATRGRVFMRMLCDKQKPESKEANSTEAVNDTEGK